MGKQFTGAKIDASYSRKEKKPVQIIIHIATTNIAGNKYRGKTANEIPIELAKYFKTSKTNLVVSSVVPSKAQLNNKQQSKRSQRTFKR